MKLPPLPVQISQRALRVLRPRDAAGVCTQPRGELARLARAGVLLRLATGYYAIVPQQRIGDPRWMPPIAAVALGVALTDYEQDTMALMGITAAWHHGAVPRALAVAVVAVPKQRPNMPTAAGKIISVRRDVARLDVEATQTELANGWVTTAEQTILDLADRPSLGGLAGQDIRNVISTLGVAADPALPHRLAQEQHKPAARARASQMMEPHGA